MMEKKCDIQHLNEEGTIAGPSFHKLFYFSSNCESRFFFRTTHCPLLLHFVLLIVQGKFEAAWMMTTMLPFPSFQLHRSQKRFDADFCATRTSPRPPRSRIHLPEPFLFIFQETHNKRPKFPFTLASLKVRFIACSPDKTLKFWNHQLDNETRSLSIHFLESLEQRNFQLPLALCLRTSSQQSSSDRGREKQCSRPFNNPRKRFKVHTKSFFLRQPFIVSRWTSERRIICERHTWERNEGFSCGGKAE